MEESIFFDRIKKLEKKLGKSFNQIERELGYSRNALANYKKNSVPSAVRLLELAEYFNVSPYYLLGKKETSLKEEESISEFFFDNLDKKKKLEVYKIAQNWMIHEIENENLQK